MNILDSVVRETKTQNRKLDLKASYLISVKRTESGTSKWNGTEQNVSRF